MGGSSSNDTGGSEGAGGAGGSGRSTSPNDNDNARDSFESAMDNANRPDRAPAETASGPDDDDDKNDTRATDKPDDKPDRASDNANRPDRAPAAPPETATKPDDDDDEDPTDKPDDRQDRAAGPPGVGAPPSSATPPDAGPAETPDETDKDEDRGFIDSVIDTLSAPPTDAAGNARSTSSVSDRFRNHTVNYNLDDLRDVFTPEQSQALADGAAVMDGYAIGPSIPSTADLVLGGTLAGAPRLSTVAVGDKTIEEQGLAGHLSNAGAYGAGVVVGAGERAMDLASELPGAALEGVNMFSDAVGTVFDSAIGWTGIDLYEGHAQRNTERGQAMYEGVTGLPSQLADGWEAHQGNLDAGNYYDAGKQSGSLAFDVATVAVPASKVGMLGKAEDVVPEAPTIRNSTPELDRVRREIDEAGAAVLTDADPDIRAYMDDAARREGYDDPNGIPAVTLGDTIMVRESFKDDVVTLREELEHVKQQQEGRVSVGVDGHDTRVDLEIEARENMLDMDDLTPDERDQIQREINTIRERGRY